MPQLPRPVVKERAARLREAGKRALTARLAAEVGKTRSVLMEQPAFGRTEHFLAVRLAENSGRDILQAFVRKAENSELHATALREAA
jgi:threonylcarbamoyladenosine tRNA methylthiotransferase MtaB